MADLFDGKYFEIIEEGPNKAIKAKCKLCVKETTHSGRRDAKSNFLRHLSRKHPDAEKEYRNSSKARESQAAESKPIVQKPITDFTNKCSQQEAVKLITALVVKNGFPLTLVEKPEFQLLVTRLSQGSCHSITRKTLVTKIDQMYTTEMEQIKSDLDGVMFVTTTADIWSNKTRSFMGMTVHYIDETTLDRKSFAIACERFAGEFASNLTRFNCFTCFTHFTYFNIPLVNYFNTPLVNYFNVPLVNCFNISLVLLVLLVLN